MAPAAADKEVGNMKEVEDESSKVGEVYIDRILLLLYCVCIYIIIGEIERGEGEEPMIFEPRQGSALSMNLMGRDPHITW